MGKRTKLAIENRIEMLKSRTKDNRRIIAKLMRQLAKAEK